MKRRKPCRITGAKAGYGNLNVTEGVVSSSVLREKARAYGVSVTVFLSAVLLCAIHKEMRRSQRELNVNRNNKALQFYEYMGMRKLRKGDFPIGNGYYMNDYIMGLDI